jgi:hypothetical protein
MKLFISALLAALLLTACSTVATHKNPKGDLSKYQHFYVEARLGDDHGLDEIIVRELHGMGYQASSGPLTMKPNDVDALIFYQDRWEWDFKTYLIEFNLTVRDARKDLVLATGSSGHRSMLPKTPADMIHEVLVPIFKRS